MLSESLSLLIARHGEVKSSSGKMPDSGENQQPSPGRTENKEEKERQVQADRRPEDDPQSKTRDN